MFVKRTISAYDWVTAIDVSDTRVLDLKKKKKFKPQISGESFYAIGNTRNNVFRFISNVLVGDGFFFIDTVFNLISIQTKTINSNKY